EQMAVLRAAAASLQTAISEHATHEDVATARAMLDLARSLARVTKPKEVAERLAEAVPGIAGVERASVWFWDPKAGLLRGEAARERLNAVAEQAAAALKNVRLVRDLKRSEERVRHQAYHDPLTGLPNRLLFEDRLEAAVASARRHQHRLALMFVDLDRFKSV